MEIAQLKALHILKSSLKDVKAKEMDLRKVIMKDISKGYEGEKKTFEWNDPDGFAKVTCDLKLSVDEEAWVDTLDKIDADPDATPLTAAEKACIVKTTVYKIDKKALAFIEDDSIIYCVIDSEPALSTIKYELED